MLQSLDILYIVLAFCALWFTIFLCWLMYQVVSLLRRAHELIELIERKVDLVERSIGSMKSRFDSSASIFVTVADGLKRLVDIVRRDRSE